MEALVQRASTNIEEVKRDPSKPLDLESLAELGRPSVQESLRGASKLSLLKSLAELIPTLEQDPQPATQLLTTLLQGDGLPSFGEILGLVPDEELLAGLKSPVKALNLVVLGLLSRIETPADVWIVAGKRDTVAALVELWLTTTHTSVAEQAGTVLKDMLRIDTAVKADGSQSSRGDPVGHSAGSASSSGLIWRRLFKDSDIYEQIHSLCSLKSSAISGKPNKTQVTTAQGRLLELLGSVPQAPQIWESQIQEVEQKFGVPKGGGLLAFAVLRMIDYEEDVLMHITLIEFFVKLIRSKAGVDFAVPLKLHREISTDSSLALDLLISTGLHERTILLYLEPSSDDIFASYLIGPAGQYIEAYSQTHTLHFEKSVAERVMRKIDDTLSSMTRSVWAHQRAPIHELKTLTAIPRQILLAFNQGSVVMKLPITPPSEASLLALSIIFGGPGDDVRHAHADDTDFLEREKASSRALFFLYSSQHSNFWSEVVGTASISASKDTAIASIKLIKAIVESSWAKLPRNEDSERISEDELRGKCTTYSYLPHVGALVVMTEPALGRILPFLLRGPENSSSDAYQLAREKHDIIPILRERLQQAAADADESQPPQAWDDMLALLLHRQRLGPLGADGQSVRVPNPEVGTMEL